MSNQVMHLLTRWQPLKDKHKWVLGVIFKTEGSCYRKAGAMMLFSDAGHQLGVLSGGCLESDIHRKAQRVMEDGQIRHAIYDDNDEEDIAFKLGVGCGGVVHLALLPVTQDTHYLKLDAVCNLLVQGESCVWAQSLRGDLKTEVAPFMVNTRTRLFEEQGDVTLNVALQPPPHVLIVGGGFDATFVSKMAALQGWTVSVWDPRPAQARTEHFASANFIIASSDIDAVTQHMTEHRVDGAILMSHHREIDSKALAMLARHNIAYLAMLGPKHRKDEILALAGVNESDIPGYFASPAGFDIGGDLPESIALSIIAQCHSVLAGKIPA
jgi:xanthine dehydrogenase accessory factor